MARKPAKKTAAVSVALLLIVVLISVRAHPGAIVERTATGTLPADTCTQIADPSPSSCRNYLLIQNSGTDNPMNVAIGNAGNGNAATSIALLLNPGDSWLMQEKGCELPGNAVFAYSLAGTSDSVCAS